jgi:hypothetical protein
LLDVVGIARLGRQFRETEQLLSIFPHCETILCLNECKYLDTYTRLTRLTSASTVPSICRNPMSEYPWHVPYRAAVFETNARRKADLIYEAIAALEERLRNPVEPGSNEAKALDAAKEGLAMLKAHLPPRGPRRHLG